MPLKASHLPAVGTDVGEGTGRIFRISSARAMPLQLGNSQSMGWA